jgi:hypothetical protein
MSVKTTLREVIERGENQAQGNIEFHFATVASITELSAIALTKLPSGERISPHYVQLVTRASEVQRDALLKLVSAQAKLQTWPLREPAAEPAQKAGDKPAA